MDRLPNASGCFEGAGYEKAGYCAVFGSCHVGRLGSWRAQSEVCGGSTSSLQLG